MQYKLNKKRQMAKMNKGTEKKSGAIGNTTKQSLLLTVTVVPFVLLIQHKAAAS